MSHRISYLVLAAALAAGCWQKVDDGSVGTLPCDFGSVCPPPADGTIPAKIVTPPILLADGSTTTDPCIKVRQDASAIRQAHCALCHEGPDGSSIQGKPLYHILSDSYLSNRAASMAYPGQMYAVPGDPDHSLVYIRAAVAVDMPKKITDTADPYFTSLSEDSVLREWITHCMDDGSGASAAATTDGAAGGGQ
jgi:hypothetical protein